MSGEINYATSKDILIKLGDDIGLTNKDPTLKKILLGAGWDVKSFEGEPPDLDISCFLLDKNDQTRMDEDFVFYKNLQSEQGEIVHKGDNRTGAGEGDDENITFDLNALSYDVTRIPLILSIHEGDIRDHDFSLVRNLFMHMKNEESGEELIRLNISDEFLEDNRKSGAAMEIGVLFRDGPKWRFHATGKFYVGGLAEVGRAYGLLII